MGSLDLSTYAANQSSAGVAYHLRDPETNQPVYEDDAQKKPILFHILSQDSDDYAAIQDSMNARTKGMKMTPSRVKATAIELLALSTVKVDNLYLPGDKKPMEATTKNLINLYTNFPRIREQVILFQSEPLNFLEK